VEGERAEHRPDDQGGQPALGRDRRERGDDADAVLGGAGQGGTRAPEVGGGRVADADEEHQAHVVAAGRHRDRGDLTGPAGGPRRLERHEEVDAERLGCLVGARAEQRTVGVREHRERPDLGPADLVRERGAERELGG
jgi:hypothetical protein